MTADHPVEVKAEDWQAELARLAAHGFDFFDFLTAVDDGTSLRVVARCKRSEGGASTMLMAVVPAAEPRLASATRVYPGATWHERETREMYGIAFTGLGDDRPLLLRQAPEDPPMRRQQVLRARLDRPWPGAAEPGIGTDGRRAGNPSRRRQRPLGVPEGRPPLDR